VSVGRVPVAAAACTGQTDCLPDVTVRTIDGREIASKDLAGKIVLVNFWATWCAPCVQEMPALEQVARAHADEMVILGVAVDGTPDKLRAVAAERGVTYPIVQIDPRLERHWGRPSYLPTSYLYAKDGHLKQQWTAGISAADLEQRLSAL
jgi:thiol-disulfide isomerase/thioredoxin